MDLTERAADDTRHPWEVARARFFTELARRVLPPGGRVLDVGAGDAYVGRMLAAQGVTVAVWDRDYTDAERAALASENIEAVRTRPDGPFDVALMLDVLEHVDDDAALLADVLALLPRGGKVIVSVPAWPSLMSLHDMRLRHRRRYTPRACRRLLGAAGVQILESGGLFHALLPPRALGIALSNRLLVEGPAGADAWRARGAVDTVVQLALRADNLLSRAFARVRLDVPGLSFFALGEKR
jgi:SAM-dependent methyltransferase